VPENDPKIRKIELPLDKEHHWTATPGCRIAVLDRGAIRFEFPQDWCCIPDNESVKFYDREPPEDNCRLSASRQDFPDAGERSGLLRLINAIAEADSRGLCRTAPVVDIRRGSLELAWAEYRFTASQLQRDAFSCFCFARGAGVHALLTFEYWEQDRDRFSPVWSHVIDTLTLGEFVVDPTSGARLQRNDPQTG
jgi:hypothetical protein